MYCRKCGAQVSANEKYCTSCGENLMPTAETAPTAPAPAKKTGKNKGLIAVIIVLAVVIVASLAVLGIYIYNNSTDVADDTGVVYDMNEETVEEDEPEDEEPEEEEDEEKVNKTDSRGQKRKEFSDAAEAISDYEDDAMSKAKTQADINSESYTIYKKWDNLLNEVYQYLKTILSEEEFEKLRNEELDWIDDKEAAMDEAASEWEGGTGEPMAYYGKGAELTRERCYELIDMIK